MHRWCSPCWENLEFWCLTCLHRLTMPTHYDRIINRPNKKRPNSVVRVELPPPHLHPQSQLYFPSNGTFRTETLQHGNTIDHDQYGHFVSEHEIKFTRKEACTPSTCICFFIAFLFSFMAIMSGIYYGRMYLAIIANNNQVLTIFICNCSQFFWWQTS